MADCLSIILGRDVQQTLGFNIMWSTKSLIWDDISIPMKSRQDQIITLEHSQLFIECEEIEEEHYTTILRDANYTKADIPQEIKQMKYLSILEKDQLRMLLQKHEDLFDGTLGTWNMDPVELELKPNSKPYQAKPMTVPHIHKKTLYTEINRLLKIGVLQRENNSEWAAPSFLIPKSNGTARLVTDFRVLNTMLKRKPYPLPKIQDLLTELGGFTYASALDLNMGYYCIILYQNSKRVYTIVLL